MEPNSVNNIFNTLVHAIITYFVIEVALVVLMIGVLVWIFNKITKV
jgi:low affinity Fe/Cu permease